MNLKKQKWIVYISERFPLLTYLLLCFGFCSIGFYESNGSHFKWSLFTSLVLTLLFFFILRLMDEVKDFEKDKIVNPTRPLPRGLILPSEAISKINFLYLFAILLSIILIIYSKMAALLWVGSFLYLGAMYKEFWCGEALSKHPFTYALTHQIIIIPLYLGIRSLFGEDFEMKDYYQVFMVAGAFFAYEVSRKCDGDAHPLKGCYTQFHSVLKICLILLMCFMVSTFFGYKIHQNLFFELSLSAILFGILFIFWKNPKRSKWLELVATLHLVIRLYIPLTIYFIQ